MADLPDALLEPARDARALQGLLGKVGAVCMLVAALCLADGMQSVIRSGNDEIDIVPGETLNVSGPTPLKNPVTSDVTATFTPQAPELRFNLEGFFAGYWFGNGMWRGQVSADDICPPGRYGLRIHFRGASPQTDQRYTLILHEDARARQDASLSLLMRHTDVNPFYPAAVGVVLGIASMAFTYVAGKRYLLQLNAMGCAEIFRAEPMDAESTRCWCLGGKRPPEVGEERPVFDIDGNMLGTATVEKVHKGTMELHLPGHGAPGMLVQLASPAATITKQRGKQNASRA
ncbi:MAG: hypothetical protein LBR22_01100 [Desulfovibrio sp.]|jgi:hypothetical protein|nr:hypothetical protein [Desulfovibrio sp.]